MKGFISNPGTGPIADTAEAHARANIERFVVELAVEHVTIGYVGECVDEDMRGRWCFELGRYDRTCLVDMPGLPIQKVRFVKDHGLSPWGFPRLYVDGSSWLWCIAIECARSALTGGPT